MLESDRGKAVPGEWRVMRSYRFERRGSACSPAAMHFLRDGLHAGCRLPNPWKWASCGRLATASLETGTGLSKTRSQSPFPTALAFFLSRLFIRRGATSVDKPRGKHDGIRFAQIWRLEGRTLEDEDGGYCRNETKGELVMSPETDLTVAIAHDPRNIEKAIERVLSDVPLEDFRDKVVAIHPNDTTASEKDKTACTRPESLRATIQAIKNLHPKGIVITGGSGAKETEEVFKIMGDMEVIESEGVEWHDHTKPPFVPVDLPFGPQRVVMVNERVLQYEKLVSLAQLKVHSTATVTMAIKNIAMSYPAAGFYGMPRVSQKKHPHNILQDKHAFLVGMLMRFPIDLAIVLGAPAMVGKGPIGGKAVETGLALGGSERGDGGFGGGIPAGVRDAGGAVPASGGSDGSGDIHATEPGGGRWRVKIEGLSVEEAVKIFRKAVYGETF